jgi:TLC domain
MSSELDIVSVSILSLASQLDKLGAGEWNLNVIAVVTSLILCGVQASLGKRHGIDWLAFVHALVTGIGGILCVYLDFFAAVQMTGLPEPVRTARCGEEALTSLHRLLPAITLGYSIYDVIAGLSLGWDFLLHGVSTFVVFAFFVQHNEPHFLAPMLLMEVSTIFLTLVQCEHFTPTLSLMNQLCFALSFFVCRIILVPYIWIGQVTNLLREERLGVNYCLPWYFNTFILVLGVIFHSLNAFWFYKIVRKVIRKMSGHEKIHEKNDLKDRGETQKED